MTTAKGRATRARILEAAVDMLVAGGAENLNLDEVLRVTRTSKGQLFHYFPGGKDELRGAATQRQLDRLVQASTPARLDTWAAWERWIEAMTRLHEQQAQDDLCEVAALAARAVDGDPGTRALVGQAYEQWAGRLRAELEKMRSDGLLRADVPVGELASAVLAAVQGGAVIDKATGSSRHLAAALRQAYVLLRGFAP
jgi:TetR/AcrR family transcriptional regulator, transcriptional repressor for nem operon